MNGECLVVRGVALQWWQWRRVTWSSAFAAATSFALEPLICSTTAATLAARFPAASATAASMASTVARRRR